MAKRAPSKHSRAARRATSPSINTDKSLKTARPPAENANHRPAILGLHAAAGVSKRKNHRKAAPSSRAKRRHERLQDRAADVAGRTAKKVERSSGKAKVGKERKKGWEEINAGGGRQKEGKGNGKDADWEDQEEKEDADGDEEMVVGDELSTPAARGEEEQTDLPTVPLVPTAVPVVDPLPTPEGVEDEIL